MKLLVVRIITIIVVIIMLLNIVLMSFAKINWIVFWSVIILSAVYAFWVLPKLNPKKKR